MITIPDNELRNINVCFKCLIIEEHIRDVFTISVMEYIIIKRCRRISVNIIIQMLDRITVCLYGGKHKKEYNEDYDYSLVCNIISRL